MTGRTPPPGRPNPLSIIRGIKLKTHYAPSGDVNIAYQVLGEGPRDLVVVFGWVSNVEVMWEEPMLARFLNRLASCARVIV